jgi:hypothetical protein
MLHCKPDHGRLLAKRSPMSPGLVQICGDGLPAVHVAIQPLLTPAQIDA